MIRPYDILAEVAEMRLENLMVEYTGEIFETREKKLDALISAGIMEIFNGKNFRFPRGQDKSIKHNLMNIIDTYDKVVENEIFNKFKVGNESERRIRLTNTVTKEGINNVTVRHSME